MAELTPQDLLERLVWRFAVKRFDPARPVDDATWTALEDALVLTPSSFGLQPWKFVVVDDPTLRQQLRAASWNQPQVTDAARYVVFLGKRTMTEADVDRFVQRTCEVRGVSLEALAGYRRVVVALLNRDGIATDLAGWNARQVYIALGQFMTAAALLGIDTSPLEGIDTHAYDRLLGFEGTDFTTLFACAAGHRLASDKYATAAKVRYAKSDIVERR